MKSTPQSSDGQAPQNGPEQPAITVDEFLGELTDGERRILVTYLKGDAAPVSLRTAFGAKFDSLVLRVQELTTAYECRPEVMRQALLLRLDTKSTVPTVAKQVRVSVHRTVGPLDATVIFTDPEMDEIDRRIAQDVIVFVDGLTEEQRLLVADLVTLIDMDDMVKGSPLLTKHGPLFMEFEQTLRAMADRLVCPLKHLKVLILQELRKSQV